MTNGETTNPPSRGFLRTRGEVLFVAASVLWAAVIIDSGDPTWPVAMWLTTALIPFSIHRQRSEPG